MSVTVIPVSRKCVRILRVLLDAERLRRIGPEAYVTNAVIMRLARVGPHSYYPIMERLERSGWVTTRREALPEDTVRPPLTFYHLTAKGMELAPKAIAYDDKRLSWRKLRRMISSKGSP